MVVTNVSELIDYLATLPGDMPIRDVSYYDRLVASPGVQVDVETVFDTDYASGGDRTETRFIDDFHIPEDRKDKPYQALFFGGNQPVFG